MLLLHKEAGSKLEDYRIEDFELVGYEPVRPQLSFELGI